MAITISQLLELPDLSLKVVAGAEGLDRPIRWAHTSELGDPTPWLSGGELLLTTGMGLQGTAELQRSYLRRLIDAKLAGLGFGLGFGFAEVPGPLCEAGDEWGFPILEVPYEVPFIAISEAISSHVAEERLREAQVSVEVHERLTALVAEGAGPADVLERVTAIAPGWALLFDLRGTVLAAAASPDTHPPDAREVWRGLPSKLRAREGPSTVSEATPEGTTVGLAVTVAQRPEAVLVFGKKGKPSQRDRITIRHAVTVMGLLLASRRAVVEVERRVAGDVLSEAFAGRLAGDDLARRLELVGFGADKDLAVLVVETGDTDQLDDVARAVDSALGARSGAARVAITNERVATLVAHDDPEALASSVQAELAGGGIAEILRDGIRIGVGETVDARSIRDSYLSALFALRAAPAGQQVASRKDLGAYGFLLGAQPRHVLQSFVRSVLGTVIDRDRSRSSDLVASVRAYIEAGGRWEQGADALGVHRHTLRYRVRQAEELLQRNLSEPEDRLEVWLALKAAEILEE
jgi:purine catabolism regulator